MLAAVLPDIGHSFREAFFMFWETLWPIGIGFGLSGAVQAFVTREKMQRSLGTHRPAARPARCDTRHDRTSFHAE